jgi:hypothetical protein
MRDVVFIALVIGFFALAALYVRVCGFIIGREELTTTGGESSEGELADSSAGPDRR